MIAGSVILTVLLAFGCGSDILLSPQDHYEAFYIVHHLVFVLFIVTIVHTFDVEQRKGKAEQSQTLQ
jgi:hypothetical protein